MVRVCEIPRNSARFSASRLASRPASAKFSARRHALSPLCVLLAWPAPGLASRYRTIARSPVRCAPISAAVRSGRYRRVTRQPPPQLPPWSQAPLYGRLGRPAADSGASDRHTDAKRSRHQFAGAVAALRSALRALGFGLISQAFCGRYAKTSVFLRNTEVSWWS